MTSRTFQTAIIAAISLIAAGILGSLAYNVYVHRNDVCAKSHRKYTDIGGIPATTTICDRWTPASSEPRHLSPDL